MDCDPDYILEKWNKIIGTKSDKMIFMQKIILLKIGRKDGTSLKKNMRK